jgi:hypothetical protein
MNRRHALALATTLLLPLSGCATSQDDPAPVRSTTRQDSTGGAQTGGAQVSATRVRFSTVGGEIVVRLTDNPTSRDLVSQLPLTLTFEDHAGREKISYLPGRLTTDGSPGSTPRNGNLFYYKPWGNIGVYSDAPDGHDDDVITLGTVESGMDRLDALERGPVTVEVTEEAP